MSTFNAARLTCFAIIAALETDGRDLVLQLDETGSPVEWPSGADTNARARFAREHGTREPTHTDLVQYLDFPDVAQILLRNKGDAKALLGSEILDYVKASAEPLVQIRNRVAHNRPLEIEDLPTLADVCKRLASPSDSKWPATADTWRKLQADPSYVFGLTLRLRTDPTDEPFHNLPVPDFDETGFLGRSAALRKITKHVLGPWPAISILGDGGIGKPRSRLKSHTTFSTIIPINSTPSSG